MAGCFENLTDPSYKSKILVLTYPLNSNYSVPNSDERDVVTDLSKHLESEFIHATGLIVGKYFGWNKKKSLTQWLCESNVPALSGIDTSKLDKILKGNDSIMAKVNMTKITIKQSE